MGIFSFRTVFGRLFVSVFLALVAFSVAMFLWIQLVHNNSDTLKNRSIARQIATQIAPFLTKAEQEYQHNNRLQARFSLVVIKKSFDIFDESLNAKIGLYNPNKQLILQTNNSNLPEKLTHHTSWLSEAMPTFSGTPPTHVQVKTVGGYTIWYEPRTPPPASYMAGIFNLFTATLLLLSLMTLVLWVIAKNITGRLDKMNERISLLGDGDFSVRVVDNGNDEITALAYGFNTAAQKIEQLINANNLLLAHASHEFRTPITRMRLQTEMLTMLSDNLSDAQKAQFDKRTAAINKDLTGLNDLIESILLVSRLDAGVAIERMEVVNLYELITQECQHYEQVSLYGEAVNLMAQPKLITHLIRNLLNNALIHGVPPITVYVYGAETTSDTAAIPEQIIAKALLAHAYSDDANDELGELCDQPQENHNQNKPQTDEALPAAASLDANLLNKNEEKNEEAIGKDVNPNKDKVNALKDKFTDDKSPFFQILKKQNKPSNTPPPAFAVFCVVDEGTGIPKDKREDIFSPFVRLKQEKKGSGLGLSLVAQIVEAHGGHITTDTWQGKTRFLVVLPIRQKIGR